MSKDNKCPVCKGDLVTKDGKLDQSDKPMDAIVMICMGGGAGSVYGCGYKSWRKK